MSIWQGCKADFTRISQFKGVFLGQLHNGARNVGTSLNQCFRCSQVEFDSQDGRFQFVLVEFFSSSVAEEPWALNSAVSSILGA